MKEHARLFNTEMVYALLNGVKTQTRRTVTPHNCLVDGHGISVKRWQAMGLELDQAWVDPGSSPGGWPGPYLKVPASDGTIRRVYSRIQPGDRIWVKETTIRVEEEGYVGPVYVASENGQAMLDHGLAPGPGDAVEVEPYDLRLRPSIFMPRSMARIFLEVTAVRVERLKDISEADAIAEGIQRYRDSERLWRRGPLSGDQNIMDCTGFPTLAFRSIWESINGPSSWAANPFVWVVEFKRVEEAS